MGLVAGECRSVKEGLYLGSFQELTCSQFRRQWAGARQSSPTLCPPSPRVGAAKPALARLRHWITLARHWIKGCGLWG